MAAHNGAAHEESHDAGHVKSKDNRREAFGEFAAGGGKSRVLGLHALLLPDDVPEHLKHGPKEG